ncbi:MAG: flagellar biosynthesis protein FlhB [Pseudomonadota bacterium]
MSESAAEKTEQATPRKLEKSREQGQIAKSEDLAGALSVLAGMLATMALVPWFGREAADLFLAIERSFDRLDHAAMKALWLEGMKLVVVASLGPMLIASLVHNFGLWLQTGAVLSWDPAMPKLERMNPAAGFKRLLSTRSVVTLAQLLLKTAIVGAAVTLVCLRIVPDAIRVILADANAALAVAGSGLMHLMLWCGGLFVLLGAADLTYQRWQFLRDQRMTLQELRRELREDDGDPQVNAARKQAAMELPWEEVLGYLRYASVALTDGSGRLVAVIYRPQRDTSPLFLLRAQGSQGRQAADAARTWKVRRLHDDRLVDALFAKARTGNAVPEPHASAILAFLTRTKQ